MGDVLTLIEKSQRVMDEAKAKELTHKLTRSGLTLADFLEQLRQMRKMGPLADLVKMIPGMSKMVDVDSIDERDLTRVEAIICSMTPTERADPSVLNASRRRRIAKGSGTQVQDVNRLVKQFDASRQMMKRLGRMRMPFAKERY
jgi:signal recognition particle subunit SRP54